MSITELAVRMLMVTFVWAAQSTRPAFEVASIRPSANAQRQAVAAAGQTDSAQFRIGGLTIKDYISMAYAVRLNQISGPIGSRLTDSTSRRHCPMAPGKIKCQS